MALSLGGPPSAPAGTRRCRFCDGSLAIVLDLGEQPPAGLFPTAEDAAAVTLTSLRWGVCTSCGLAQLEHDGPDEVDDPAAPPPTSSATMSDHARSFVASLLDSGIAAEGQRVAELASHRGYLYPFFRERGIATTILADTPAEAQRLAGDGASVLEWPALGRAGQPSTGPEASFDLIVDNYLLAHLPKPGLALDGLVRRLNPGGTVVFEFDHLLPTVESGQFDAIRHGHRSYISLTWLRDALGALGLDVIDAFRQPVYGGALRIVARQDGGRGRSGRVEDVLAAESRAGITRPEQLAALGDRVESIRRATLRHLELAHAAGRPAVGYGAPARAVTFLNALGIGPALLPMTADRAPAKQGRVVPGSGIPIVAPDALRDRLPADVLVLAWDLATEIRASQPWVEEIGGRWMVAIPELARIGSDGQLLRLG